MESTFVGRLHVFFFKHQVVALHCSRVELQPENNFPYGGDVTLVVAFNLEKYGKLPLVEMSTAAFSWKKETLLDLFLTMMSPFRSCAGSRVMQTRSL